MSKIKRWLLLLLLVSLAGALIGCQAEFQPGTYTDDAGREINITKVPERIVSHVPAITEILYALDLGEKLVGVDDYSDYPAEAKSKPSVGNYWDPSIESIVALEPDIVLTDGQSQNVKQLDSLGITYMVIYPDDIDGILQDIELLGKVTGATTEAQAVIKDMRSRISRVTGKVAGVRPVKVFYTFATTDLNNPWTAGPGSFVDSLIGRAGGENVAAGALSPYAQFSIEEVVSADPEIIVVDASMGSAVTSIAELRQHPVWRQMRAIKEDRIYAIDGNLVNRYGPRIVQGLEELARFLHPELFP